MNPNLIQDKWAAKWASKQKSLKEGLHYVEYNVERWPWYTVSFEVLDYLAAYLRGVTGADDVLQAVVAAKEFARDASRSGTIDAEEAAQAQQPQEA